MIFYLSSLPNQSFDVLKQVYYAELKSQSVPRSKKGTIGKHLDLKGNQFKCLRGLEVPEVHRLLIELKNSKISLKEMGNECATIKQMQKVQVAFIRGTNCKNWDEPCERFPLFTTAEQLEPFKKLDFSGKTLPPTFMKFCQRATTASAHGDDLPAQEDQEQDNIFCVCHQDSIALFWREKILLTNSHRCGRKWCQLSILFQDFLFRFSI